jgi:Fe2+ transport system protein FeoA
MIVGGVNRRSIGDPDRKPLAEILTGEKVVLQGSDDRIIAQRMLLHGLIDGTEVEIETRSRNGDLIIVADGARFHVPAHQAGSIWVTPVAVESSHSD